MPRYDFTCEECEVTFEVSCSMSEISDLHPSCPHCNCPEKVYREFGGDIYVSGGTVTIGSLCDKNTSKMSSDERGHLTHKHTEHRRLPWTGPQPLPKGHNE